MRSRCFPRAALAALAGLAFGGASAMADPAGLSGGWLVRSASGPGSEALNAAKPQKIAFAEGQVRVSGACNALFGPAEAGDSQIEFGPGLASTRMACPGDRMASDQFVADVFHGSADYSVEDGVVRIVNGGRVLVLERATGPGDGPVD
ncbi:MAG: META domain-containing protein [Segniliparus sp.]|uniref:META domain-containing protein n=1 Tax=Segniliparus sp. TaxID=2804064 RepID=UPI003F3F624D